MDVDALEELRWYLEDYLRAPFGVYEERGPKIDVEAALHARGLTQHPQQYLDPISLGSLIISVATLAWTVYTDLKNKTPTPYPAVIARTIRLPGEGRQSGR